mmetsp:Transcript_5722/g.9090  ORF Transcript_5722/g.9090 Transcript_5722/m.9090 type:complete len:116 (-) Transcript_5722:116-463(-)
MEYIGVDIYLLFYLNGAVIMISGEFVYLMHPWLGLKRLIIVVQIVSLLTATFIALVHERVIKYDDPEQEERFFQVGITAALLFLTLSIQIGFTGIGQSLYEDERLIPYARKGTAA